jgi:transposase
MSQNNFTTTIHAGIDVAKATLQLSLGGASHSLANDPKGHARILRLLAAAVAARPGSRVHVILEATGGYEAALCAALHAAGRTLSVIQPSRVRHFASAKSEHAKTDSIDADVLTAFGEAIRPAPTPPPSAAQTRLELLVGRRAQLVETRTAELNRAEHYTDKLLRAQNRALLNLLDRQIAQTERAIAAQIAADETMKARAARVQQVPGIGPVVAAVLQAQMPELGTLSEGEAAALAGLAPYNRDSGPWKGTRCIRGGPRPGALRALHGGVERRAARPHPARVLHPALRRRQKAPCGPHRGDAQAGGSAQPDAPEARLPARPIKVPPERRGLGPARLHPNFHHSFS